MSVLDLNYRGKYILHTRAFFLLAIFFIAMIQNKADYDLYDMT